MKKAIMLLLSLSLTALAQKPKVAVGAIGDEPENFKALKFLSSKLSEAITNSGEYEGIELSEDISKLVGEELYRQESGAVDEENQIRKILGKQSTVDYLCIVQSTQIEKKEGGKYLLEVKFVDVESLKRPKMKTETSNLMGIGELESVAEKLVTKLLKEAEMKSEEQKEEQARQERERERQAKLDAYQNFTMPERFGTLVLNHALGLGSLLIMENTGTAGWIALGEAAGVLLVALGVSAMPDRNSYSGVYADSDYELDRKHAVGLIVFGSVVLGITEIANVYSSFTYNKPKPIAGFTDPRNFRFAILPNRNGDGMAYGLMYKARF